jgi:hypothetical protein
MLAELKKVERLLSNAIRAEGNGHRILAGYAKIF